MKFGHFEKNLGDIFEKIENFQNPIFWENLHQISCADINMRIERSRKAMNMKESAMESPRSILFENSGARALARARRTPILGYARKIRDFDHF